jgi:hypothetical protein
MNGVRTYNVSGVFDLRLLITHVVSGTVVVVIAWWLDLQLPVQSVPITTNVVGSNPVHGDTTFIYNYKETEMYTVNSPILCTKTFYDSNTWSYVEFICSFWQS